MTETIRLVLPGRPTPKGRPRFSRNGRTYTDAKTRAAEESILAAWLVTAGARAPHAGPVEVEVVSTFLPPDSWPKWKRERALAGEWPHVTKPDNDNLVKILDGLNGRAWIDDSQIVAIRALKQYGPAALSEVLITLHPVPEKETK